MTDLTDPQRIERGRRAALALEEFQGPAVAAIVAAYSERLEHISSTAPWEAGKITALANAIRIAREVEAQMTAFVYEAEHTRAGMIRATKIEALTPTKRRLLHIGPF